jgi:GT2 family glycosyltransferase
MLIDHLEELEKQDFENKEIIVVDNGSSDNTSNLIRQKFPDINLITLKENTGCAGRNYGIKAARNEIVVTLDDDVIFCDDKALQNIKVYFRENKNIGAMTMKILDLDGSLLALNWFHPKPLDRFAEKEFSTDYIPEGAVAFRKSALECSGLYPESFFLSHEGPDLAYRIINQGFEIRYNPIVSVYHKCSTEGKTNWRYSYFDTRNQIWLAVRNYPFLKMVSYILYRLFTTFLFCIQQKKIKWYFKAIFDGFKGLPAQMQNRYVLSPETMRKLRKIRKEQPSVVNKFMNQLVRQRILKEKYKHLSG